MPKVGDLALAAIPIAVTSTAVGALPKPIAVTEILIRPFRTTIGAVAIGIAGFPKRISARRRAFPRANAFRSVAETHFHLADRHWRPEMEIGAVAMEMGVSSGALARAVRAPARVARVSTRAANPGGGVARVVHWKLKRGAEAGVQNPLDLP